MSKTKLNPFIFFGGNCREVMEFYRGIFCGNLSLNTYAESPPGAHSDPKAHSEEMKSKIMHARLEGEVIILGSDNPHNNAEKNSGQFSLSLEGSDKNQLSSYFEKLSEGGIVLSPLQEQFWGVIFGMVTDKFGVTWMLSIEQKSEYKN